MLKPTLNFFLIVIVLWGFKNKKNDSLQHIKKEYHAYCKIASITEL